MLKRHIIAGPLAPGDPAAARGDPLLALCDACDGPDLGDAAGVSAVSSGAGGYCAAGACCIAGAYCATGACGMNVSLNPTHSQIGLGMNECRV